MDLCIWNSVLKFMEADFYFFFMFCVWQQENGGQFLENKVIAKMLYPCFSKPL